jgi:hypothetical protein
MNYLDDPEYCREIERLIVEIELEDEMAKASQHMEMQALMEEAHRRGKDYGKGFSDGFVAGVKFHYEKESAKWRSRKEKYEKFNRRGGIAS